MLKIQYINSLYFFFEYMNFNKKKLRREEYPVEYYKELLIYIKTKYANQYWHVLPKKLAQFWMETFRNE